MTKHLDLLMTLTFATCRSCSRLNILQLIFALFLVLAVRNKLLSDRKVQVSLYKRWKQECSTYWIKKQIEPFCIHPSKQCLV